MLELFDSCLDLIAPARCVLCERFLTLSESDLCAECRPRLTLRRVPRTAGGIARWAIGLHSERVRDAVLAAKLGPQIWRLRGFGAVLGRSLSYAVDPPGRVLPVPASSSALARRGGNPVVPIARGVARAVDAPVGYDCLERVVDSPPQKTLSRAERLELGDVFRARRVENEIVLVVDDVTTTGATLDACARALSSAGARHVVGATVAWAEPITTCDTAHSAEW